MRIPHSVDVIDVTLRDGLQHEEMFVPTETKLWIANHLIDAGFKRIEIGTFSHIKYVPQFKDILELLKLLPKNPNIEYTVLALNTKACERVAEALDEGVQIDRVLCGQLATSEAYAKLNMNRTHEELFAEAKKNVRLLHDIGINGAQLAYCIQYVLLIRKGYVKVIIHSRPLVKITAGQFFIASSQLPHIMEGPENTGIHGHIPLFQQLHHGLDRRRPMTIRAVFANMIGCFS